MFQNLLKVLKSAGRAIFLANFYKLKIMHIILFFNKFVKNLFTLKEGLLLIVYY